MLVRRVSWVCGLALALALTAAVQASAQTPPEMPTPPEIEKLDAEVASLTQAGKYSEALPIAERAIALAENMLGPDHADVAKLLNDLAGLFLRLGRLNEVEPLYKRSAAIYEKALGSEHPYVGTSLNNLATLYDSQGRYDEAEQLYKRSLTIAENAGGADHPDVIAPLLNLAKLYKSRGRTGEAEPIYKRTLALTENTRGADHTALMPLINNLAKMYYDQGRYRETEPLYKRSLAITEKARGPDHPDVVKTLNDMAVLYRVQGRFGEAEPLFKRSLAIVEKAMGPEHFNVAAPLNNLADLYLEQDRFGEAEVLVKRSLALLKQARGPEHPDVATSLNNLATLYDSQGRYDEAEQLYKRSLTIAENALGPEHPDVATLLNNLAGFYKAQGRFGESEPLYKKSLALREQVLGRDHPDVAASLNSLATLYQAQDRFGEAAPLLERSLVLREKTLGADHLAVGQSLNNLAAVYLKQDRLGEAEALFKRSIAILENALGPEHSDLAAVFNNLAEVYNDQGRLSEAEPLYKRSFAIFEKALGAEHPGVAPPQNNLAQLYKSQRRFGEAERLYKRNFEITEKALGPDHPSVATALNSLAWLALAQNDLSGAAGFWQRATAVLQRRAARGLGGGAGGSSKGEAQQRSWYFEGLVKTKHRLASEGRDAQAQRATAMFETAQWSAGSEAAATLAQMAARSAGGSPLLSVLVRERQDLMVEWQGKDKKLIVFRSQPPEKRDAAAERHLTNRLAAIDRRLVGIDATLAKDFPNYADLASHQPVSVKEVQAVLGNAEALVLFLDTDARFEPLPEETFVWVVTQRDVSWFRSNLGRAALRREVAALRCGLDATAWYGEGARQCGNLLKLPPDKAHRQGEPLPFDLARAHALYTGLLGEATDIIKGKHLLVVPSGALTTLPFQVLVTRPPKSQDLASARWLARDHAITVLPSAAALKSLRRVSRPSAAPKPMIGFANPLLDGYQADPAHGAYFKKLAQRAQGQTACATTSARRTASLRRVTRSATPVSTTSGLANLDHLKMQTPLPETADEVCAVARSIKADVREMRIGARATEREIKRLSASGDLARFRIVHLATHGLLAGQLTSTSEPGLILTPPKTATIDDDGYLSASEIAALKLDADWVILSACNTAGGAGQGEAAEALSGLARVFFYGGARALLVSHWEVDSDAAVKLVTAAIGELSKSKSIGRGEALRRAMRALMADTSRPKNWVPAAHPSIWAPFVVVGEGSAGR